MEYSFSYPYVTHECCFYHPAPPHLIRRKWARTLLPPHPMNSAEWKWPVLKMSHGWSWVSKVLPLLCLKWLGVWSESFTELIIFFTACSTLSTAEPQTVLIRQSGETRVIHLPNIYQHLPGNLPTFQHSLPTLSLTQSLSSCEWWTWTTLASLVVDLASFCTQLQTRTDGHWGIRKISRNISSSFPWMSCTDELHMLHIELDWTWQFSAFGFLDASLQPRKEAKLPKASHLIPLSTNVSCTRQFSWPFGHTSLYKWAWKFFSTQILLRQWAWTVWGFSGVRAISGQRGTQGPTDLRVESKVWPFRGNVELFLFKYLPVPPMCGVSRSFTAGQEVAAYVLPLGQRGTNPGAAAILFVFTQGLNTSD